MPRKARVWWPGATYHVMCRGNHQHEIYRDDEDREVYFEELLNPIVEKKKVLGYFGEPKIQMYQAFLEKGICQTVEGAGTLPERLMLDIGLECEERTEGVK